jgi:ribosomal protein S18 acetylase RimI-like enzyme
MLPDGYVASPTRPELAGEIAALINRYDTRNGGIPDFSEEDLKEIFRAPFLDPATDSIVVNNHGELVAAGVVWPRGPKERVVAFGAVDPDHHGRGLGSFLFDFVERRAGDMQQARGEELTLHFYLDVTDDIALRMVDDRGFKRIRDNYTMYIEFGEEPIQDEVPDWLTIRTCTRDDARLCHALVEETFAEHFGNTKQTYEEWATSVLGRDDFDPTLWWLAFDGDEPAGLLLASRMDHMGWVADLGVRKPYRKRGIAATLLRRAFAEFQRRGMKAAGLGVDAQNETGAVRLYESVGMHSIRSYGTFEKKYRSV